jgi:hypothetical protein
MPYCPVQLRVAQASEASEAVVSPLEYGGDDETRTRDLCRDSLGIQVLSATYKLSGGCQVAEKDRRNHSVWVNLWVRILALQRSELKN